MTQPHQRPISGLLLNRFLTLFKVSLGLSLWWLVALPVQAAVEMRVAVAEGRDRVAVGSSTPALVKTVAGQSVGQIPQGQAVTITTEGNNLKLADWQNQAFWVEPTSDGYIFIDDAWYRGRVLVLPNGGKVTAINWVDLEEYLYSVLGAEMPASWPQEALKAQAVAARSFALNRRDRSLSASFDVDDTTANQVYRGLTSEAPSTIAAVNATRGQVLTYNGRVIEAVFHSSSGGYTENVEDVWQQSLPYLRSVPDFDQDAPVFRWSQTFTASQFQQRVTGVGRLQAVAVERFTPQGRVASIRLQGTEGSRTLTGTQLRQALGLRSTLFSVSIQGDSIRVDGRGFGHGIGMSQWGARGLALQGYSYVQILAHYYQSTTLSLIQIAQN
ncbi:MAG: SpoIID/LytB domain-containing protein [Leptolyngbya sp.]|nr:SpoIID/LytB domain-containing protein [Leptolyngbya sp.]